MKTMLVTGAARRGGAAIARRIHHRGYRVILHCRPSSLSDAEKLAKELNAIRNDSAIVWSQELNPHMTLPTTLLPYVDSVSGIVANASSYIPSNLESFDQRLDDDIQTHVSGHLQLIHLCKSALIRNEGSIVAITDIHVERASKGYLTYQIAKGALATAVRALAVDLAPQVRVNAVAPGTMEWPASGSISEEHKAQIIKATPLGRTGTFDELAAAVEFLLLDATFTTGATLTVDGGTSTFLE